MFSPLLTALAFAADKHRHQKRKDDVTPYINHPIAVAELMAKVGEVTDVIALQAALLHDTVEDTETSAEDLTERFGQEVSACVMEVTDDKSLPQKERKQRQVVHAPHMSDRAKLIKLCDKSCNIGDLTDELPIGWSRQRKLEYLDWAEQVVAGCRGTNAKLEAFFDTRLAERRTALRSE